MTSDCIFEINVLYFGTFPKIFRFYGASLNFNAHMRWMCSCTTLLKAAKWELLPDAKHPWTRWVETDEHVWIVVKLWAGFSSECIFHDSKLSIRRCYNCLCIPPYRLSSRSDPSHVVPFAVLRWGKALRWGTEKTQSFIKYWEVDN